MILSILIPTLYRRTGLLSALLNKLNNQINQLSAHDKVEILVEVDDGNISTGNKRNTLVNRAAGVYVVHIDDDDTVTDDYLEEVLKAAELDYDAIVYNGWMTTDGINRKNWFISKDLPYCADYRNGEEVYLRYPNHIVPIKKSICLQVPFPNKHREEDYDFALMLHKSGLIKTEAKIDKQLYHYDFRNIKP